MKKKILSFPLIIFLLTLLLVSTIPPTLGQSTKTIDWPQPWGDIHQTNYSPQDLITSSNINNLILNWYYPLPLNTFALFIVLAPGGAPLPVNQGAGTPVLVVNGIVYFATNDYTVYAINSKTGNILWKFVPINHVMRGGHIHTITYNNGMIWVPNEFD